MKMLKCFPIVVLFILVFVITACEKKAESSLIGKWQTSFSDNNITVEFLKDGTFIITTKFGQTAKYKIIDDKRININENIYNYTLTGGKLIMDYPMEFFLEPHPHVKDGKMTLKRIK